MIIADLFLAGVPPNWHWRSSLRAPFLTLRLTSGEGTSKKSAVEPDRGVPTSAIGLRRRSIICRLAFLDRLVSESRGPLDCPDSQWNHLWHRLPAHFHGHAELSDGRI